MDMSKRESYMGSVTKSRTALIKPLSRAALIILLALGIAPPHVSASRIRFQTVAFGDSLLDAGTYSRFAGPRFGGGRFTTNPGLNFTQEVARHYGDELTPAFLGGFGEPLSPAGGLDYAQGGSRVTLQPGLDHAPAGTPDADFAEETTVPVKDQVTAYLAAHKRFNSRQLVLIEGGANDIFFQLAAAQAAGTAAAQKAAEEAITRAANDLADVVATVVANGATHVAVMNLPDIGMSPQGVISLDQGQSLTQSSQLFNTTLANQLQQEDLGGRVILIDSFTFIDNVIADSQANGFTASNTQIACDLQALIAQATQLHLNNPSLFGQSLFCSPETLTAKDANLNFMFADMVHPTTHLNALFAQFVEQQVAESWFER
jgi:phospholipase/lecithinase/hemolysin